MTITVIIPTHNRAALLQKTLESLSKQSNRDFQVLVVDHGSTDHTEEVCAAFREKLALTWYWLEKTSDAPGYSRHMGMQQVTTPLVVFLDCSVVVPSFYIDAHLAFHREHAGYVGLGYYHGYSVKHTRGEVWPTFLEQTPLDKAESLFAAHPELADDRWDLDIDDELFAWTCGWTGNYSLHTEDYWSVGGFDIELEAAYEDIELSYRLTRQGIKFAVVRQGWGVHLPHSRLPGSVRRKMQFLGREHCYQKLRSLGFEVMLYIGQGIQQSNQTFAYLSELGRAFAHLPSASRPEILARIAQPALLIGGTVQDAEHYAYVTLANEDIISTPQLWSCCGTRIPLDDHALPNVVVTDMWKWLYRGFNQREVPLLECLVAEIRRTAQKAYFLDTPQLTLTRPATCSREMLIQLCQHYDLPCEIISIP